MRAMRLHSPFPWLTKFFQFFVIQAWLNERIFDPWQTNNFHQPLEPFWQTFLESALTTGYTDVVESMRIGSRGYVKNSLNVASADAQVCRWRHHSYDKAVVVIKEPQAVSVNYVRMHIYCLEVSRQNWTFCICFRGGFLRYRNFSLSSELILHQTSKHTALTRRFFARPRTRKSFQNW